MNERNPAEPQLLTADQLIVYEALATLRRPMKTGEVAAATGRDERTVRAALGRLERLGLIVDEEDGATVGPNQWDVR
jgi:predicted transcriptional regulator